MIKLTYTEVNGLLYPDLEQDDAELYNELGKYGNARLKYLHRHKPEMYRELLLTGRVARHCANIEQSAFEMAERIRVQYLERNPPPPEDTMARIQAFTQAQAVADECVFNDLVYC